jgi:hypothetical protein
LAVNSSAAYGAVTVAVHDAPVGQHDPSAEETVAGQPVPAAKQPDPATERETGEAVPTAARDGGQAGFPRVRDGPNDVGD